MKKIFLVLIITLCCKFTFAQINIERQVIGSTGNYIDAGSIKASSTVGEAVTPTLSQATLIVTQGFQQPVSDTAVIDIFTGEKENQQQVPNISVYPNPTTNNVILDFKGNQKMEISIDVYNEAGQSINKHFKIALNNNLKQEISFNDKTCGNYFITVKSIDGKLLKAIKVEKIN